VNTSGTVTYTPQPGFSGADLAIEPDAGVVLRDLGGGTSGIATQPVLYGAGLVLIAVAILTTDVFDVPEAWTIMQRGILWAAESRHAPTPELVSPVYPGK